jgi:hypothetical protein
MIKAFSVGSAAVLIGLALGGAAYAQTTAPKSGSEAMKLSQAECQSLWNRLDASKSGSVAQAQAQPYVTDFKAVDSNNDGKLSQAEFQAGCDKGQVHSTATTGPATGGAKK